MTRHYVVVMAEVSDDVERVTLDGSSVETSPLMAAVIAERDRPGMRAIIVHETTGATPDHALGESWSMVGEGAR
jgi:hypothetical protein